MNMPAQVLTNLTNANYGNTANPTQAMNLVRDYTYDTANRLSNWSYGINIYSQSFPVQTDTYIYDNNGNRLTKQVALTGQTTPEQTNYAYDFENRLNQLTYANIPSITGTQTDSLIYNGEGLRTQAVLNSVAANYLYDGSNILVERDGTGNTTKTYTRGLDFGGGIGSIINQNYTANNTAVTQYYDYNDLGSTSDLTTSTGSSASSYSFDAFGNLLTPQSSSDTNRYLFSTKEFDLRSGLYFFGKRYFDPEVGRWITPDPLGFVNGPNLYLYVLDNPINMVDPDGLCLQDLERVIGGVGDSISDFLQSPDGLALTAYLGVGASLETSAVNVTEATATANSAIENNFQRFVNNLPAQAETPTTIEFGDGSVAFQAKVPATNIPGSYAVYEKQVDAYGNTTQFTITTYAPDGSIVYVKNKLTGEVLK